MDRDAHDPLITLRDFAPFAGASALAWITVPIGTHVEWLEYGLSVALLGAVVGLRFLVPTRLRAGWWRVVPTLVFLAALGLLRNAGGGIGSAASAVAIVPVFFTALQSDAHKELYAVLVGLAIFYIAPILLVGPPTYPHTQYRAALLSVAVSSIIGLATQQLVGKVRRHAEEASLRKGMLEDVGTVVRSLYNSPNARADVCVAAKSIGEATVAVLFEPDARGELLVATAAAGLELPDVEIPVSGPSAVARTFSSQRPVLINDDLEAQLGSRELWESAGRPESALYEPLLRGVESVGVLSVGWAGGVNPDGSRATVVGLLAHEAASVLARADTMDQLADMAETDPLTGLPNRRAWDAQVARAFGEDLSFTIAMLDLDHFKRYNDTRGHQAGDWLLHETAARWRDQLRAGDLLARLGGEEFGLLLIDFDAPHATEVVERLRGAVVDEQTCSAGLAARRDGEAPEQVMARADAALYEAKAAGRDRVLTGA